MIHRTRKRNRLDGYDYGREGHYFITYCVKNHLPLLCKEVQCAPDQYGFSLSEVGQIVLQSIEQIPAHYHGVSVDKYVIMPNHVHMILVLGNVTHGRTVCAPTRPTIPIIVKSTKEFVTKALGYSLWQKSYHDHIIRNEADYRRIWQYIDTNPATWQKDCYYEHRERKHSP